MSQNFRRERESRGGGHRRHRAAVDDATFTFGNAHRVMRDLANDVDLFRATIEFPLYHVGQQIKLDLWKGDIINWQFHSGAEFEVTAADGRRFRPSAPADMPTSRC